MNQNMIIGIVAAVVIGGGVVGAGFAGVVDIPGITPKKGEAKDEMYGEEGDLPEGEAVEDAEADVEPPAPEPEPEEIAQQDAPEPGPVIEIDEEEGQKKLARLWNEIEPAALAEISKDWSEEDLAPVLAKMDPATVAELLATLEPERSSKLSKQIQSEASRKELPVEVR